MTTHHPSRRTFLRGVGASMALPWMESLVPRFASAATVQKLQAPPVRSAFIFFPNGVVPNRWTPEGDGESYELSPMLQSMAPHTKDILLMENLWHEETVGRNGHWPKVPAWLSGGFVERGSGGDLDTGGTSLDQFMAQRIGDRTVLPSFELGIDTPRTGIDNIGGGFPRILGSHIAWRDPHTPVMKENIPQLAFDRLFRTGSAFPVVSGLNPDSPRVQQSLQRDNASVLDLVLDNAKALRKRVSGHDKDKLDEYLESVRSVEKRIEAGVNPPPRWENKKSFDLSRPAPGIPKNHQEHVRLMMDIMLLAFWTDTTRIATFMMGDAQTGRSFHFLEGVRQKGFHGLSHHRNDPKVRAEYENICVWHVEQFAWLVAKMKSLDEGGSSLLDNSQILFGSSLKDGNRHDPHDLPLLVAGKAGGQIKSGRRLRSKKDTPMSNLLLSMAKNMGMREERFGKSDGTVQLG